MFLLKVKAFADFDIPYYENLALFNSLPRVTYLKNVLNSYVESCPELNSNIRFSKVLEDTKRTQELVSLVSNALSGVQLDSFMSVFIDICLKNYVYINSNIFEVEEVKVVV